MRNGCASIIASVVMRIAFWHSNTLRLRDMKKPAATSEVMKWVRSRAKPQNMARPGTARKAVLASWTPEARAKREANRLARLIRP